jgi:hypothetical protein
MFVENYWNDTERRKLKIPHRIDRSLANLSTTNSTCMSMVRKEGLHGEGAATRCQKHGKAGQFIPLTYIHVSSSCFCPFSEHAVNYVIIYERLPTENLSQPLFTLWRNVNSGPFLVTSFYIDGTFPCFIDAVFVGWKIEEIMFDAEC